MRIAFRYNHLHAEEYLYYRKNTYTNILALYYKKDEEIEFDEISDEEMEEPEDV